MRRTEISGLPRAQRSAVWTQAEASARSDFKNLSRAGVLKKMLLTVMTVPSGQPVSVISWISPAVSVM